MGIFRKSLLLKVLGIDYVYALLINGNPKSFGIFQIKESLLGSSPVSNSAREVVDAEFAVKLVSSSMVNRGMIVP